MDVLADIEPPAILGLDTPFQTITQAPGLHMTCSFIQSCSGCRHVLRDGCAGRWAGEMGFMCVWTHQPVLPTSKSCPHFSGSCYPRETCIPPDNPGRR